MGVKSELTWVRELLKDCVAVYLVHKHSKYEIVMWHMLSWSFLHHRRHRYHHQKQYYRLDLAWLDLAVPLQANSSVNLLTDAVTIDLDDQLQDKP